MLYKCRLRTFYHADSKVALLNLLYFKKYKVKYLLSNNFLINFNCLLYKSREKEYEPIVIILQ